MPKATSPRTLTLTDLELKMLWASVLQPHLVEHEPGGKAALNRAGYKLECARMARRRYEIEMKAYRDYNAGCPQDHVFEGRHLGGMESHTYDLAYSNASRGVKPRLPRGCAS